MLLCPVILDLFVLQYTNAVVPSSFSVVNVKSPIILMKEAGKVHDK